MPIKIGDKTYKPHQISEVRIGNKLYYRSALPKREISYYGTATALTEAKTTHKQVANNGVYVVSMGGQSSTGEPLSSVEAYNSSLVKTTATSMTATRLNGSASRFGDYSVIGGGYGIESGTSSKSNLQTYESYDKNLVHSGGSFGYITNALGSGSNNNYCIFCGGYGGGLKSTMKYISTSFTVGTGTSLGRARQHMIGTQINNRILIAGGINTSSSWYNNVDAYNENLVHSTATNLTEGRYLASAGYNDTYAFIFGGYKCYIGDQNRTCSAKVDVYDKDLVHSTATDLTTARGYSGGFSHSLFAGCVAGGREVGGTDSVVDYYDNDLVKSSYYLNDAVTEIGADVVGNYIITCGGAYYPTSTASSRTLRDIVQVSKIS